jgi:hypothetical protein
LGLEPATFWLVAQCLNQLRYCMHPNKNTGAQNGICALSYHKFLRQSFLLHNCNLAQDYERFEALTAGLWVFLSSGVMDKYQRYGGTCCFHLQGRKLYWAWEDGTVIGKVWAGSRVWPRRHIPEEWPFISLLLQILLNIEVWDNSEWETRSFHLTPY